MQVYKDLNSPKVKEFEQLLNSQSSKSKIEEGKIIDGKVAKITEKYIFVDYPGLKSEAVIDVNEYKTIFKNVNELKVGDKISVLLEKLEDRNGEILVSAVKAFKILGWNKLVKQYENNEPIFGKIISRVKGGVIFEEKETKTLTFMPGSQISDKPLKDISHLMNVEMQAAIIKCDYNRGNICTSRRAIISSNKKEDKAKIIEKYKVGDVIKNAVVKSYTNFGVFFDVNNGELDCLVHLGEVSYSRVNHPDEIFNIGDKHDLKVISVDKEKLQVGCSIKQLLPDPFDHISNYEIGKSYKVKIVKITDYGAFAELEPGLSTLLHSSEISWTKKKLVAKKSF